MKKVLAQEESMIPALFFNLRKVIRSSDIHTGYQLISSLSFAFTGFGSFDARGLLCGYEPRGGTDREKRIQI